MGNRKNLTPREDGKVFYGGQWRSPASVDRHRRNLHRPVDASERTCPICGKTFPGQGKRICCTDACSAERNRRKAGEANAERSRRRAQRRATC